MAAPGDHVEQITLLARCHYAGAKSKDEVGALIAVDGGIQYTGATRVSVRWADMADFQLLESNTPKGRKRSAVGFGAIGVAVVGATMVHNHRAGKMVTRQFVRVTTTKGTHGDFVVVGDTDIRAAQAFAQNAKQFIAEAR